MAADDKDAPSEALSPPPQLNGASAEPEASSSPVLTTTKQPMTLSVTRYLRKDKEQEWNSFANRDRPLTLLELPFDILSLIVKEVNKPPPYLPPPACLTDLCLLTRNRPQITHTNDLTALALTNSQLHSLAMPHIYARFDIVWPDGHISAPESKSVDALTYGLSTLCLGSSFARTTRRFMQPGTPVSRFKGNSYAKFTRKFSLGNGPTDWVAEYMINKESGKMLGTLVALAVAKMQNLEIFVWDMPTGVSSDIFMALASLDESPEECKLDRVWIRWHDNNDGLSVTSSSTVSPIPPPPSSVPLGSMLTPIGIMLPTNATHPVPKPAVSYAEHYVEYPTFSVLPPLKSLTVLEIDELAYLDEMAVLIERSKDRLQELRVGISAKATDRDFVQTWDGSSLRQIDHKARWPGESSIGDRRLGGVLGVLVGKIYDIKKRKSARPTGVDSPTPSVAEESPSVSTPTASTPTASTPTASTPTASTSTASQEPNGEAGAPSLETGTALTVPPLNIPTASIKKAAKTSASKSKPGKASTSGRKRLDGKLKLQTLELERVPLSMQVCRHAIDWSVLTNLTILDCAQNETLWKMLKRQFQPTPMSSTFGISASSRIAPNAPLQYHLALKRIHTDHTSQGLINFIKETLAPNSLEILFLQDRRRHATGPPPVTIDQIFKGAIKRHRSSLRKLLLDSSARITSETTTRWRYWLLTTEILEYITSGRMSNLRELAVSLAYKDWHTFLQRLPNVPQLRSINIPYIADHAIGNFEPKELAMQIADIITLRPEVQLCYVGIATKCFELLETRDSNGSSSTLNGTGPLDPVLNSESQAQANDSSSSSDEDGEAEDTSDEEIIDDGPAAASDPGADDTPASPTDQDETQSEEDEDEEDSDVDSDDGFVEPDLSKVKLRLREILFYDDKVAIFKARHGKL
ncbi:hypothetical protein GQ53DRAFT_821668 [Thozetella sp. PMI_491]|nr:hypothetical protein GQ53DRAFT_821668 [Thozetella sp. PMI_491]